MGQESTFYRSFGRLLPLDTLEVQLRGEYFSSLGQFDFDGLYTPRLPDTKYDRYEGVASAYYSFYSQLMIGAGGRYRQNRYEDGIYQITKEGFESVFVSFKYGLPEVDRWFLAVDVSYINRVFTNTYLAPSQMPLDVLPLGDDQGQLYAGLSGTKLIGENWQLSGSGGYLKNFARQSDEVNYAAELVWAMKSFALFAGVNGVYSLLEDQYIDRPEGKPVPGRVGSQVTFLVNSINQEYLRAMGGVALGNQNWALKFWGGQVLLGYHMDKSLEAGVAISLNSFRATEYEKDQEKIQEFKEYELEAEIVEISPKGFYLKINKGLSGDVDKSMLFDIYKTDYFGGNVLVASGEVVEISASWAIIKIAKTYKKIAIRSGFIARGY